MCLNSRRYTTWRILKTTLNIKNDREHIAPIVPIVRFLHCHGYTFKWWFLRVMAQVVEDLPAERQETLYSTKTIPWLGWYGEARSQSINGKWCSHIYPGISLHQHQKGHYSIICEIPVENRYWKGVWYQTANPFLTDWSWPITTLDTVVGSGTASDCRVPGWILVFGTWSDSIIISFTLMPVHGGMFSYIVFGHNDITAKKTFVETINITR